jgi:hypothetical protein
MTSESGVKGEELGKQDRRRPIPSANNSIQTTKDIMISMDKHFPINRGIDSEDNRTAMEDFIGRHGNVRPANIDDGNKIAMYHDEDVRMITMDADGEDARDQRDSEVSNDSAYEEEYTHRKDYYPRDGSVHWVPIRSSHRDGSIYCTRGTFGSGWKNDYRIADRNESK